MLALYEAWARRPKIKGEIEEGIFTTKSDVASETGMAADVWLSAYVFNQRPRAVTPKGWALSVDVKDRSYDGIAVPIHEGTKVLRPATVTVGQVVRQRETKESVVGLGREAIDDGGKRGWFHFIVPHVTADQIRTDGVVTLIFIDSKDRRYHLQRKPQWPKLGRVIEPEGEE